MASGSRRDAEPHQSEAALMWQQHGKSACGVRGASWAVVPVMHCGCTSVTVTLPRVCRNSRAPVIFCRAAAHLPNFLQAGGGRKEARRFIPVELNTNAHFCQQTPPFTSITPNKFEQEMRQRRLMGGVRCPPPSPPPPPPSFPSEAESIAASPSSSCVPRALKHDGWRHRVRAKSFNSPAHKYVE